MKLLAPLGAAAFAMAAAAAEPAAAAKPAEPAATSQPAGPAGKQAKVCFTCHKTVEPGNLRGLFDDYSLKSSSLQLKIDGEAEVLFFDAAALKVENAGETGDLEKVLKSIKKGHEARVAYTQDGSVKRVTLLALKPKLKVAPEKQVSLRELENLVAQGPEKGKYFLFDARPAPRFADGYIPTAVNLPFPAFEKEKGKLPEDRAALVVFYCSGVT
jgi:hypothetical protein